jgi:hypothetical protein
VNFLANEPLVGAIGIKGQTKINIYGAQVDWFKWYIVRSIEIDGIVVSMISNIPGKKDQQLVVTRKIKASTLSLNTDGYFWLGWIYPLKGEAHEIYYSGTNKQ